MKIAYMSGAYIPSRGANSMHVMRMCQAMGRFGHDVTLYVRPGDIEIPDDYGFYGVEPCFRLVKIARPQVRVWGAAACAWRTRQAVKSDAMPDLIYAREYWALFLLVGAGVPFVFESHWKPKSLIHKAVESMIMRHPGFQRVVLISDELRKIYSREYPWLPEKRKLVAHDGADPIDLSDIRVRPLGREGVLQVGYVGSFWPGYGIGLVERLAAEMPDVDFNVIGGDPEQVEERRGRATELKNLRFHGFVAPAELPDYYAAIDLVLAPYQKDAPHIEWISPMKLFEYMANGKAIVCSDFPVMREIIDHGRCGLLVPADDLEAWKSAIRRLSDVNFRAKIGQPASRKLASEFTWETRAQNVLNGVPS